MKRLIKIFLLLAFFHGFVILLPIVSTADLIEPTRSLTEDSKKTGYLSVFSEPPEQEVWLDEEMIGLTPIVRHKTEAGSHVLKISDTKTKIYIVPDKKIQLGLLKGKLVVIPQKQEKKPKQTTAEQKTDKMEPKTDEQPDKIRDLQYDPVYWPQNPSGPIYPKKMAE